MGEIDVDGLELKQRVGDEPVHVEFGLLCTDPPETLQWGCPVLRDIRPVETGPPTIDRSGETPPQSDGGELSPPDGVQTDRSESDVLYRGGGTVASGTRAPSVADDDPNDGGPTAPPRYSSPRTLDERVRRGERAAEALLERLDANDGSTSEPTPRATDGERTTGSDDRTADRSPTSRKRDAEADVSGGTQRSYEVRLDHLSARVEEFAAYASALEAIIADYGTGEDVLTDFEQRLQSIETQLDAVREDVTTVREAQAESIAAVRDEAERATDRVRSVESDVRSLSERLEATEREVAGVTDRQDALETTVEVVSEDVDSMVASIESLEGDVESLNSFRRSLVDLSKDDDL